MVESMQEVCRKGLEAYPATPRSSWVLEWPSQVVLAVSAIFWTQEVSGAIRGGDAAVEGGKGALAAVAAKCTNQLNEVVELVRGELSALNRCGCAGQGWGCLAWPLQRGDSCVAVHNEMAHSLYCRAENLAITLCGAVQGHAECSGGHGRARA
jgi:hypothetical protein